MAADTPKIVLTPQERSHYFNKRECVANEPLKVGRSVDRRRISPNNLIFDCRVLSRNHAVIWFENGKFFIKDTKSSNGTFVNENRLSPSSEESGPVELKSRDVVQFGVNVNVDKKVTHGCIIATVKLFMNDVEIPGQEPPVQQVMQILMSALAREQELETKLASMQSVLNVAKDLATDSMIAIVKEDELMSRLEMLENQLHVYSRNSTDDELKKQLARAFEDKHKNELASKDSLRGVLQEKLECVAKLSQLQRDYDKAEQDCQRYQSLLKTAKEENSQEVAKLTEQLKTSEEERKELETKLVEEKKALSESLDAVQADADFMKGQLDKTKARLDETESELVELKIAMETEKQRKQKALLLKETKGTEAEEAQSSSVSPGTEDPVVTSEVVSVALEEKNLTAVMESCVSSSPRRLTPPSPFERRDTIIPGPLGPDALHPIVSAKLMSLESDLRMSQGRVKLLEEQLGLNSTTSIDTESTTPFTPNMVMLAKKLSDSAITKGQLEVLQQSLLEAENLIMELKSQNASSFDHVPPDSRGISEEESAATISRLKDDVCILEETKVDLESRLLIAEEEAKVYKEKERLLEIQCSVINARFTAQSHNNVLLKKENHNLELTNDDLQRRVDELCSTLAMHKEPEVMTKHVKFLTIIALVSIGVALASWLAL